MRSDLGAREHVLGVDVGGTKIAAGLVDLQGKVLSSIRRRTDLSDPEATLDSIAAAVNELMALKGIDPKTIDGVGFGIPGLVDAERGLGVASVNLGWKDIPVRAGLEARLKMRCAIDNDVRAGAMGEARFGAARGLKNWVYLNIGTGISVVVFLEGRMLLGVRGLAGEIGHAVLVPDGPKCKCGGRGRFEAVASGPAIAERAFDKSARGRASILFPQGSSGMPEGLNAEGVFEAAAAGDPGAVETLEEIGTLTAYALQFVALAYDPQLIVIGGSVMLGCPRLFGNMQRKLRELADSSWVFGKIYSEGLMTLSTLGNDAGVLGAAALAVPEPSGTRAIVSAGNLKGGDRKSNIQARPSDVDEPRSTI